MFSYSHLSLWVLSSDIDISCNCNVDAGILTHMLICTVVLYWHSADGISAFFLSVTRLLTEWASHQHNGDGRMKLVLE